MDHQGPVPADSRHRFAGPARGQLGESARVLRAVLFRHRAAVRRRVVEPRQVSVQVELVGTGLRRTTADAVRRPHRSALHGIPGADRCLPIRGDGTGQDLHRCCQEDRHRAAGRGRRSGDVLQHRSLRSCVGMVGHGVGHRHACRTPRVGCRTGGRLADPDLSGLHQFRCSGNGFGDRGTIGVGATPPTAGRSAHRPRCIRQALPGATPTATAPARRTHRSVR